MVSWLPFYSGRDPVRAPAGPRLPQAEAVVPGALRGCQDQAHRQVRHPTLAHQSSLNPILSQCITCCAIVMQ
jgi:hypothetical protein